MKNNADRSNIYKDILNSKISPLLKNNPNKTKNFYYTTYKIEMHNENENDKGKNNKKNLFQYSSILSNLQNKNKYKNKKKFK